MSEQERQIPIKIAGHWQEARVHTHRGDLLIDIPAELLRLVEADLPGRGAKFGYQLLVERGYLAEFFRGDLRRRDELHAYLHPGPLRRLGRRLRFWCWYRPSDWLRGER